MSDTPRTDEAEENVSDLGTWAVSSEFARVLERENAALLKDAARYRWLKAHFIEYDNRWAIHETVWGAPSLETLDAAIDAAMGDMSSDVDRAK